ncbi:MAG: PIN domain-containing protein [Methanospirillaceae archaeon]|nr:PIN domain-containing protein [Methanospirillaceae archaeon]
MGIIETISGSRLYLDSNISIYALEGYPEYESILTSLFSLIDNNTCTAVTSELTLAEVLIKPLMDNNLNLQQTYTEILQSSDSLTLANIDRHILIEAAMIRASSDAIHLPDAIHLATAKLHKCSCFITNDKRLRNNHLFQVIIISDLLEN